MIPYRAGKLTPNLSHLTRGLVKYVPGRGYFCAVPSQNGDKYVTSPPPPQSLNWSLHGGQSRSWSAEQGKKEKGKSLIAPPPPPRANEYMDAVAAESGRNLLSKQEIEPGIKFPQKAG